MNLSDYQDSLKPSKPRAKPRRLEDDFHKAVKQYLTAAIGPPGTNSHDELLWFSLESRGKRSLREGAANKSRGVIAGVPDVCVIHSGRVYFMELKAAKGRTSPAQRELHRELAAAGVPVMVVFTLDDVRDALAKWRVPTRLA